MNEEKMRILKMIEEGKISAEEGGKLLDALDETYPSEISPVSKARPKVLKIRIREGDKTKVNITVPMLLAKLGMKFIPKEARMTLNEQNIDLDEVLKTIEKEVPEGKIVDIEDDEGKTKVEITIE